jgi:hypothetical protein
MRITRRTTVVAAATGLALAATVTTTLAALEDDDGVHLQAAWANGGHAWLELEDRNVVPAICFIWQNDLPQDGDGIESRILTRDGTEVLSLGVGEQWIDGGASGCETVHDTDYRAVFEDPDQYAVEFRVLEDQGTPATPPVRSGPLGPHDGSHDTTG